MVRSRMKRVADPLRLNDQMPMYGFEYGTMETHPPHMHDHDCLELGICLEGAGIFHVGDTLYDYGPGDAVMIPEGIYHFATTVSPGGSRWRYLFTEPLYFLDPGEGGSLSLLQAAYGGMPPLVSCRDLPEVAGVIGHLAEEAVSDKPNRNAMIKGLLTVLAVMLSRVAGPSVPGRTEAYPGAMDRISPAFRFIFSNYGKPITVDDIAASCSMSKSQVTRLFSKVLGQTPMEYLNGYRARVAGALLRNGDSTIAEIAAITGFASHSSFDRNFKAVTGSTPREWRAAKPSNRLGTPLAT